MTFNRTLESSIVWNDLEKYSFKVDGGMYTFILVAWQHLMALGWNGHSAMLVV